MGQGGYLTLVNETDRDWIRSHIHSYQMNSWSFPDVIRVGQSVTVYIEWNEGIFNFLVDDAGEARYYLDGTEHLGRLEFEVQARAIQYANYSRAVDYNLQIYLKNLVVDGHGKGSIGHMGWRHNGYLTFILGEWKGKYGSAGVTFK